MTTTFTPDGDGSRIVERTVSDEYGEFDLTHILPSLYHKNHDECPTHGSNASIDATMEGREDNGDGTQTITIEIADRPWGDDEADEDDWDELEQWTEDFLEWVATEDPEANMGDL